jgi:streptomycin 6-kinase
LIIPDILRRHAAAAGAEAWLDELPAVVRHLEQRWNITVGGPFSGGTEAYVVEATTVDGQAVVVKVLLPSNPNAARHEITALRLADGEGCVALLRDDPELGALLLERLGPSLFKLGLPVAQRLEILCDTVARMWCAAPDCGLPTGADRARQRGVFIAQTWEMLDRPCSEQAIDHALDCAHRRERAHDEERAVLVHGDVHQLNALEAGEDFKLIDPDGVLAEAECDLGILMRGDPVELLEGDPRQRARWLAARTGLDPTAIWEWGVIERVASGLHCEEIDFQPLGRQTLAAVDAVVGLDMSQIRRHPLRPLCNERRRRGAPELPIGARRCALPSGPLRIASTPGSA